MKHFSDNKSVRIALRKSTIWIFLPFFLLIPLFGIVGFYIIDQNNWSAPVYFITVIGISILIPAIIMFKINRFWFKHYLHRVSDKLEFYERALRYELISPKNADKIILRENIIIPKKRIPRPKMIMETIKANHKIILSSNGLSIDQQFYSWNDIHDFKYKSNAKTKNSTLTIILKTDKTEQHYVPTKLFKNPEPNKVEYLIDKYLNFYKQIHL